jgi:dTDP-4-dehydrorhamnose 3,5-epimerase
MKLTPTRIPDVVLVEPKVFGDSRGFFTETWHAEKFRAAGIDTPFVQDNLSGSRQWVLRGLHYQIRHPQGKLVRVTVGDVFDVAVDLRRSSPTFGEWVGQHLSAASRHMLWIPPGFAHGFLVLSEQAEFFYKSTDFYDPASERCVRWDDPQIGIQWPLPIGTAPVLSDKDRRGVDLAAAECYE